MVRDMTTNKRMAGTAVLAIMVGGAALLWHLLACTESPMAYSPNGRDLAFVTMEPYDGKADLAKAGQRVYRLMVLSEGKTLRVLEETTTCLLTAPAYSPDGKHLCYVRVPLLPENPADTQPAQPGKPDQAASASDSHKPSGSPAPTMTGTTTGPSKSPELTDQALPRLNTLIDCMPHTEVPTALPVTLVVRDSEKGGVISSTLLEIPVLRDVYQGEDGLLMAYITSKPQYSPDGKWVYFSIGDVVVAIDPANAAQRVIAAPAAAAVLSPDGKTVAFLQEHTIGLAQTDGERTLYRNWAAEVSLGGLCWVDKQSLLMVEFKKGNGSEVVLHYLDQDGSLRKSVKVQLPQPIDAKGEDQGQLAVAPDGKHMVLAFQTGVFFLDAEGKVIKTWHKDQEMMAQPTFSPDGRTVAFKVLPTEPSDSACVTAIALFTTDGAETARVPIPRINPAATQSATQPAGKK